VRQTALRAKMLDDRVRRFISRHPDAVVVALGAGRGPRVDPTNGDDQDRRP
jgi:O-methyltransferase involved in polyketide biosynthesis